MWKSNQKLIPLSKIHASGSNYYLAGFAKHLNPANYVDAEDGKLNTFKLASLAVAMHRESTLLRERLNTMNEISDQAHNFKEQIHRNDELVTKYHSTLRGQVMHDESLPIDIIAGYLWLESQVGKLDQAWFNNNFLARVSQKLPYASLQGLSDLAEALSASGYPKDSEVFQQLLTRISEKLESHQSATYVDYAKKDFFHYIEAASHENHGTTSSTAKCNYQSKVAKAIGPDLYNKLKMTLCNIWKMSFKENYHYESAETSDVRARINKNMKMINVQLPEGSRSEQRRIN